MGVTTPLRLLFINLQFSTTSIRAQQVVITCSDIHPGWVELASLKHDEVPSPGVTTAQAKLVQFVTVGASALHTSPPFGFNPGDATGKRGIGV